MLESPLSDRHPALSGFASRLLDAGLLSEEGLREAMDLQAETKLPLHQAAFRLGLARERDLLVHMSTHYRLPLFEGAGYTLPELDSIRTALSELSLPAHWLLAHDTVIWFVTRSEDDTSRTLLMLAKNPLDSSLIEELTRRWSGEVQIMLASNQVIERLLGALHADTVSSTEIDDTDRGARMRELAEEAPVIDFVNRLFSEALELDASDVHIEPGADGFETRFRVDGVLSHSKRNQKSMFDPVCTRIKILSGMDISERRLPQDGRQTIRTAGEEIDLRVSSLPATYGESIVLRLLRKKSSLPDLEGLGIEGQALEDLSQLTGLPNGVVIVTGPTGSGKSTTLYRALEMLNDGKRKIITIEDPVEYDIDGINQVQVHADIGLTFASGLRSMLRQDPDVIMLGEIRDQETAVIAIQAALTGHLVFSTLHTNSALGAIERLQDLGVEPFLISSSLRGVVGQRLLRRLCPHCSKPHSDPSELGHVMSILSSENSPILQQMENNFHEAVGCSHCNNTGYQGRIGVYEVINFLSPVFGGAGAALEHVTNRETLRQANFISMVEDGLIKASRGQTSLDELSRVFGTSLDKLGF